MLADDPELLHAEPKRIRMQAEPLRGVTYAVDPPSARTQHLLNMHALDGRKRGGILRRRRFRVAGIVEQRQDIIR